MDTNCTNCKNLKEYNKDAYVLMKSQEQTTKNVLDGWINFCKKLDHEKRKKETLTDDRNGV